LVFRIIIHIKSLPELAVNLFRHYVSGSRVEMA
jgi:hypothetical protein